MYIHVYIYIYIYIVCMYTQQQVCVYIHIYIERERGRDTHIIHIVYMQYTFMTQPLIEGGLISSVHVGPQFNYLSWQRFRASYNTTHTPTSQMLKSVPVSHLEQSPLQILGYGSTSQPAIHDVRQHHLPSAANHQQPSS